MSNCICLAGNHRGLGKIVCREGGRISWDETPYIFLHFRFDDCICRDPDHKKCDCIIFRFGNTDKPVMFVVETKGDNPSFAEVKEQIECGLETMINLLPNPKDQFRIVPVLCAGRRTSFMKEASLGNLVGVLGKKRPISICLHSESINGIS